MKKILPKLVLSHVLIVLFSIVLLSVPVIGTQVKELTKNIEQNAKAELSEVSVSINSFFDIPKRIIKDMEIYVKNSELDIKATQTGFKNLIKDTPALFCLYYADSVPMNNGGIFYSSDGWIPDSDYDKTTRDWYIGAKNSTQPIFTEPYIDGDTSALVTTIAYGIRDGSDFKGAVAIDILLKDLNEIVGNIKLSKTGVSFLIDQDGNYLTNDDGSKIMHGNFFTDYPQFTKNKKEIQHGTYINLSADGGYYSASCIANDDNGWIFVTIGKSGDLFASVIWNIILVVIVAFASVLLAFIISLLSAVKIVNPIKTVDKTINEIASGNADLTKRLNVDSNDEIGSLEKGFNKFVEKLQEIISQIQGSKSELENVEDNLSTSVTEASSSIVEIISNIESVGSQVENQVNAVSQTSAAVAEIAENINSLENMIQKQADGVQNASSAVEEMIGNISSVNQSVEKMAESFARLEESAKVGIEQQQFVDSQISEVSLQSKSLQDANLAISNIAGQTNLLAMNAAIEAAHAGEAGKGFAVVADEIRKLSETSSSQSKKIGAELHKIVETINGVVEASAKSTESFNNVSSLIGDTDQLVRHIRSAMEEQNEGSRQILDSLKLMNDSTSEVKTASHEMEEGNQMILNEIHNLQDTTLVIKQSMQEMSSGASNMNKTSATLSDISSKVRDSIYKIGGEIDQFKA